MRVSCITNKIDDPTFTQQVREELATRYRLPYNEVHLTRERTYVVYAISVDVLGPKYLIADDNFDMLGYPHWYEHVFFHVIDARLSRFWKFYDNVDRADGVALLPFRELTLNGVFFERLIDLEPDTKSRFDVLKAQMDLEFACPSITAAAEVADGKWLLCPTCYDAWESSSDFELVVCPKCQATLLNPLTKPTTKSQVSSADWACQDNEIDDN
jgi:hypothetical protein